MFKFWLVLVLVTTSPGCVVTPNERFADTLDQVRASNKIDVVIDSFVVSDIKGESFGYNETSNRKRSKVLKNTIVATLREKGYEPNVVFVGSGFQQKEFITELSNSGDPEEGIMYSENWKSTGRMFENPVVLEGASAWAQDTAISYFETVLLEARGTNVTPPQYGIANQRQMEEQEIERILFSEQADSRKEILNNPPAAIVEGESTNVLFVKYANIDVSAGKKFSVGLLGAAATLAVSGGDQIGIFFVSELGPMEFVLMDTQGKKVLWAVDKPDTSQFGGREFHKVQGMLEHFPVR